MSSRFVRLQAAAEARETETASAKMTVGGQPLDLEITAPTGATSTKDLLPIFQGFTNAVVDIAVEAAERQGFEVSCRKGCAACCRQLVPVSPGEARALVRLVETLPEPHRSHVRERFESAVEKLDAAGVLDAFRREAKISSDQFKSLGLDYFDQAVACPFLEEESCSIYSDRPLSCREYLVTSPAEECSRPNAATIRTAPLAALQARALQAMEREVSGEQWIPLVLALEWTASHPEQRSAKSGTELVTDFFVRLSNQPQLTDGSTARSRERCAQSR